MLGLIAFALLILACSYWKLSGYLENNEGERDLEAGTDADGDSKADAKAAAPVYEEKFLVIMAGQEKPTYLATPISSRASSFGSTSGRSATATEKPEVEMGKPKEAGNDQVQVRNTESTHETAHQVLEQVGNTESTHVTADQVP